MKVSHNISTINYLLRLYRLSVEEFLQYISKGLKRPITEKEIFSNEIEISHLKRIDRLFGKGVHYYLDPKTPNITDSASIFFRKEKFNTELNIGAKKIVNQFEDLKISLSAISKLSGLNIKRKLPIVHIDRSPRIIAFHARKVLYPKLFVHDLRGFLKTLIESFASYNILVFEFVETWNKKEKANINGFFISPNVIVLKRQQAYFRREIFTLAHELGHYLLNIEEIEQVDYVISGNKDIGKIENWCNEFAYYFLAGPSYSELIRNMGVASSSNDYNFELIEQISKATHLSKLAIFTRLLYTQRISSDDYNKIKFEFEDQYRQKKERERREKEFLKAKGIKQTGSTPKPIYSPLLVSTAQIAFQEGIISEYDVYNRLRISPSEFEKALG